MPLGVIGYDSKAEDGQSPLPGAIQQAEFIGSNLRREDRFAMTIRLSSKHFFEQHSNDHRRVLLLYCAQIYS